jgi:hypothetical protein
MTHTVTFAIRANDVHRYQKGERVEAFDPGIIGPSDGHKYEYGALVLINAPVERLILEFPAPIETGFPSGTARKTCD